MTLEENIIKILSENKGNKFNKAQIREELSDENKSVDSKELSYTLDQMVIDLKVKTFLANANLIDTHRSENSWSLGPRPLYVFYIEE